MNIQVLCQHGLPELTGIRLIQSLEECGIKGVDKDYAQWKTAYVGRRYDVINPALAYPGKIDSKIYWELRPAAIIEDAKAFDLLLDVHDRPDDKGEYVQLSPMSRPELLGAAALLGIRDVLLAPPEAPFITNHIPHALVVEMTRGKDAQRRAIGNVMRLRNCLARLAVRRTFPACDPAQFNYYNVVCEILANEAQERDLDQFGRLMPFQPLPAEAARRLGLRGYDGELVVDYWNGINSSEGEYFGGVLARTKNPFAVA